MKIEAFSKTYGGRCVLDFPGIELMPGRIYAVVGANGSGKSTFAKILSGIIKADRKGPHLDTASVLYMPQKPYAFRMSVDANIRLGSNEYKMANKLMEDLQIDHLASKRADRLSGGETARMALARLMMRYTFTGWYSDENCVYEWNFETMQISQSITLYAGWEAQSE